MRAAGHLRQPPPQTAVHIAPAADYNADLADVLRRQYESFRAKVLTHEPFLGKRVAEIASWDDVKLLVVQVNRLRTWWKSGLLCIGDAAHAMYPRGGSGSNQALVDARVLADSLARIPDPAAALRAYEDERREKANAVVLANRREGPDVLMTIVDQRTNGKPFDDIEKVLPFAEADKIIKEYHRLAGMPRPSDR